MSQRARQRNFAQNQDHVAIDDIPKAPKILERKVEDALHIVWDDLPSWLRDNQFIHTGYRPVSNSYQKSFASLGYLHNESVNIYTHLLGALVFIASSKLLHDSLGSRYESASRADVIAIGCFLLGVSLCLAVSGTYHTICNHSHAVATFGNKLDYLGIVFTISGSFVPSIYYGFKCEPKLQKVYWTMIAMLGTGCALVTFLDRFRTASWRPYRAGMFALLGLSAVFPVGHGVRLYGIERMRDRMGLSWALLQGFLYLTGAGLYAARVPERLRPGTFDIWGSSHQIFHVLVLLAAASHLVGVVKAFDHSHGSVGQRC